MLPIKYYSNDNTQPTHHDFQNVVEFEVTYSLQNIINYHKD